MKLPPALQVVAENLATQDNRITAHPIFIVQQRRRIYNIAHEAATQYVWVHEDGEEASKETAALLEQYAAYKAEGAHDKAESLNDEDGVDLAAYSLVGYIDIWEFVTACFTEAGCKAYLECNGHNLTQPRIYVDSGHRNQEWQDIRAFLLENRPTLTQPA